MHRPLSGLRVVELGDPATAFAGRVLADLGAEVVVVEPPGGSRLRHLGARLPGVTPVEGGYRHLYMNAGKRSVVIDRQSAAGAASFAALLATTDVLLETERLGHATLCTLRADLVQVTVTPFGLDGPWRDRRANDAVAIATGGLATFAGPAQTPPNIPAGHQALNLASLAAATAVLFALYARRREPGSAHVDISLQRAVAWTTQQSGSPNIARWFGRTQVRPAYGSALRCADGRYTTRFGVRAAHQEALARWAATAGVPFDAPPPGVSPAAVAAQFGQLVERLAAASPRDEVLAWLWSMDASGVPIHTLGDLDSCEHLVATGHFQSVDNDALGVRHVFPRSPVDAIGDVVLRRAPLLGEHTASVLAHLPPAPGTVEPLPRLSLADALAGVRIVDFCWVLAGPLGTRLLANCGADVIRVESGPRGIGDPTPPGHDAAELGNYRNMADTGKRSLTVDPRTPRGRALLLELIGRADAVTENYRAGSFAAMGFDFATLARANPRIVCAHLPGLGAGGPWSHLGMYGPHVAALSGLNALTGFPGQPPVGLGAAFPDFTSPYVLATLVTAALLRRDASAGGAADLDIGQLTPTIALVGPAYLQHRAEGSDIARNANRDPDCAPHGIYPTAGDDQWLAIAVEGDAEFARFVAATGVAALADPRFATHAGRKAAEDALDAIVAQWTRTCDKWAASDALQAAGIAAGPVEDVFDMMTRDPQLGARYYQRIRRPAAPDVDILVPGDAITDAGRPRPLAPAPAFGADNAAILCGLLGHSAADLERWQRDGVVRDYSRASPATERRAKQAGPPASRDGTSEV
jgi:crotonobetainyl-CoA:carnitine CoA-transferase CaiB-like acyl-CoA transferase